MDINLGKRIKELRTQAGLSTTKLSKITGISSGYISELENNAKSPSAEILLKIIDALNITVASFFNEFPSEPLPKELKELVDAAKNLSSEDIDLLLKLIKRYFK